MKFILFKSQCYTIFNARIWAESCELSLSTGRLDTRKPNNYNLAPVNLPMGTNIPRFENPQFKQLRMQKKKSPGEKD